MDYEKVRFHFLVSFSVWLQNTLNTFITSARNRTLVIHHPDNPSKEKVVQICNDYSCRPVGFFVEYVTIEEARFTTFASLDVDPTSTEDDVVALLGEMFQDEAIHFLHQVAKQYCTQPNVSIFFELDCELELPFVYLLIKSVTGRHDD